MDGQGNLNDLSIQSALKLTNIVLLHFHYSEFNEIDSIKDLANKVNIIKDQDKNIQIILIVRDAQC
jgi:hypothetical protein